MSQLNWEQLTKDLEAEIGEACYGDALPPETVAVRIVRIVRAAVDKASEPPLKKGRLS